MASLKVIVMDQPAQPLKVFSGIASLRLYMEHGNFDEETIKDIIAQLESKPEALDRSGQLEFHWAPIITTISGE